MKKRKKGRSGKRPLRGETLMTAVRAELAKMVNLSSEDKEDRINVSNLVRRLGISRQSIYNNGLEQEIEDHAKLQRVNFSIKTEAAALRRPLEVRIEELDKRVNELLKKLDGWVERWTAVEHNARLNGYDADLLFAPISPPLRKTLIFKRGKKKS